jgi:hypothetical protein
MIVIDKKREAHSTSLVIAVRSKASYPQHDIKECPHQPNTPGAGDNQPINITLGSGGF